MTTETTIYAGRVLRCRDGRADVALIQPQARPSRVKNCENCGGEVQHGRVVEIGRAHV